MKIINLAEFKNQNVDMMSPLVWAYVGDAVYETYIRTYLSMTTKLNAHNLHIQAIKYVKAKSQAELLKKIQDNLTEEEKEIVRRGRNTNTHHLPKNADMIDYMYSTAFESLIGYLYLKNEEKRLQEILKLCVEN